MAQANWTPGDWKGYFDAVAGKPARETLVCALGKFEEEEFSRRGAEHAEEEGGGEERLAVDEGAKKPDGVTRTYHTRAQVEAMLAAFEVEMLDEQEKEGKNAYGVPKYWHAFHVVARKKA